MTRFANLNPEHRRPGRREVVRWAVWDRMTRRRKIAPPGTPATRVEADLHELVSRGGDARITWIGHASFLVSLPGANVLIDPVFSECVGIVYPRHVAPGLTSPQLPRIDLLLVTHSHYDHLDDRSVCALPRETPVVCPRGLGRWFRKRRFRDVRELNWWESAEQNTCEVTFVPARHWTQRTPFDFNRSHWGGYVVRSGRTSVYHAGDSAWFDGFAAIGEAFPVLDATLLPIGAYSPAWFMERNHMTPEQAGEAFLQTGAQRMIPMHYGTFQLTDEPLCEPLQRLEQWWNSSDAGPRELAAPAVGETIVIDAKQ